MPEEVDNRDLDNRTCGTGLERYIIIGLLSTWALGAPSACGSTLLIPRSSFMGKGLGFSCFRCLGFRLWGSGPVRFRVEGP